MYSLARDRRTRRRLSGSPGCRADGCREGRSIVVARMRARALRHHRPARSAPVACHRPQVPRAGAAARRRSRRHRRRSRPRSVLRVGRRRARSTGLSPWPPPSATTRFGLEANLFHGDGLGKVSRLIDIERTRTSKVIRKQLKRHDRKHDLKQRVGPRDVEDVLGVLGELLASLSGDG